MSEAAQSCPTLCDPMDCSIPGSSVHGIFQARVLEWVAISFSRGSSRPRDRTRVSCIAGRQTLYQLSHQGSLIFFSLGSTKFFLCVSSTCMPLTLQTPQAARPYKTMTSIRSSNPRDFPGGPVVRTLHVQCRGPKFDPWSGN